MFKLWCEWGISVRGLKESRDSWVNSSPIDIYRWYMTVLEAVIKPCPLHVLFVSL